jgi:dTDP-4-amino-4,6-dideoxygalactose transaminase
MKKIPFIKPNFPSPELLVEDIRKIYENNYYSNNGPVYFEFKKGIEKYLGQNLNAVVVSNATAALMLAIYAVFDQQKHAGKKYIAVPSFTFAAAPLAIKWCGFEPLFFDIELGSSQPSIESFEEVLKAYEDDIAGVVLINNFGIGNAKIEEWATLLESKNIKAIIDSAPGFGSTYADGNLIGGMFECEVFSFHATKPFGIGEGGLISTKNSTLASRLESLKNFGFDEQKMTSAMGLNAKITELDCAIGLRVLEDYPERLKDRRKTYAQYKDKLSMDGISFLPHAESAAIQFATIIVPEPLRVSLLQSLMSNGVEARTYYAPAVHTFPFFGSCPHVNLENTDTLSSTIVSLPVHPHMDPADIDYVCRIVTESIAG